MTKSPVKHTAVPKEIRKRLAKLAGNRGIAILDDLFSRLGVGGVSVPAASFRVAHEAHLDCVRRLVQMSFIAQVHDAPEIYRLDIRALPILSSPRAHRILKLSDDLLRYIVSRYRQDPDNRNNTVAVSEFVAATDQPEAEVREALRYLVETPAVTKGSTDFPETPDTYAVVTEQSIAFPTLEPLMSQLANWTSTNVALAESCLSGDVSNETHVERIIAKFENNRLLAWLVVLGIIVTSVRGIVAAIRDLTGWVRPWLG